MGMAGAHFALAVYPGELGIQSYLRMGEMEPEDPFDWAEVPAAQECLMCSFENKDLLSKAELAEVRAYTASVGKRLAGKNAFPQFKKFRIGRYPWRFETEQDAARMREALSAALHVSQLIREHGGRFWSSPEEEALKMLRETSSAESVSSKRLSLVGAEAEELPSAPKPNAILAKQDGRFDLLHMMDVTLPLLEREADTWTIRQIPFPDENYNWPKPVFQNAILTEHLRRAKKKGVWECGTIYAPFPVQVDDADREAPYYPLLMIAVKHANGRQISPPIVSETGNPEDMVQAFAECLRQNGCPKTILVGDDRCFALLTDLCQKIGIELNDHGPLRYLYEALEDFLELGQDDADMDEADSLESLCEMLMGLPDEALSRMPPSLLRDVNRLADAGLLPEELTLRLSKLR